MFGRSYKRSWKFERIVSKNGVVGSRMLEIGGREFIDDWSKVKILGGDY